MELQNWILRLCACGGGDDATADFLLHTVASCAAFQKELEFFLEHGEFLGKMEIEGYSVIDVMVWQIDHFKSHMDRGEYAMKYDPDHMVLMAFATFAHMLADPKPYVLAMQSETGTDYPEKF